jgi:protein phosphatase
MKLMDLLRRLFGIQPADASKDSTKPSAITAPEISAPGTPIEPVPAPVIQPPSKRSTEEIAEAARTDPTPMLFGGTRQLPPLETFISKPGKHVVYGLSSDIGMIRGNNQDSMYAMFGTSVSVEGRPDFGLFIVADGMGGHHDGERASAIAIRTIAEYVTEKFYISLLKSNTADAERPVISEVLAEAVQKANDAVSGEIPEGGTTVTSAAILGDLVYIGHVGDSRAYLITADGIEQITRDHSLVQRLIELDQLTPEEAAAHPQRNVLYRAIGQSENLEVDTITRRLTPGSRLLLCSDGLWNQISESNLQQIIQSSKNPQDACDQLIRIANDRGGPDNITVILIQIPG